MLHGDNDISLFEACINIAMGLGDLFQWISPIDDWFNRSGFDQLFERKQIIDRIACGPGDDLLVVIPRTPSHSNPAEQSRVRVQIGSVFR